MIACGRFTQNFIQCRPWFSRRGDTPIQKRRIPMALAKDSTAYISKRDPALKVGFAIFMAVAIAALGWVMITVSSSPTVKGASFLWLPAALQLVAGVWLGPIYGTLAGGIGAYAAGILA